jgi:hypothetical protein
MTKKFSLNAPKSSVSVEEFMAAADVKPLPWEDPRVRDDVMKLVSLRLSEPYILKLQWLSEQTGKTQQKLLKDLILPWIDEEVAKRS